MHEAAARERAEHLLSDALALPQHERRTFVERSCGDDVALRDELLSLLEHAEPAEDFFRSLAQQAATDLPLPRFSAGRFEIIECIGVGGMGAVYRAHDARLQRDVALKFVPALPNDDARVLQEARAVAALEHPNICTVHEIAETEDGRSFIAMTLYDGETLRDRLARGRLEVNEALDIAVQAARGLSAAHAHGIVHRDIKPGNIMLTPDGTVKLLDFGLATSSREVSGAGAVSGTIPYMSTELLRGEPARAQSDLWSLGVVLYEMLAGQRPFGGQDPNERIAAILKDTPAQLHRINRRVPAAMERIVSRLLERDLRKRYPSADELLHDLERVQAQQRRRALLRSRRVQLGSLATVVVLLAGATSVWRQLDKRASVPATIAVLPFAVASGDTAQNYLAVGLRDELSRVLSQLQGLRVVGYGSASRLKPETNVAAIGRELGAAGVLTGKVERVGDTLRVHAQLFSASNGRRRWEKTYRMPLDRMTALHHDVALDVATALDAPMSAAERAQLSQRAAVHPDAYASYLRGRYFWHERTANSYARAQEYFERAIAQDSLFAPAWAGLASVYVQLGMSGRSPVDEAAAKAREAAERAVALADNSAEAHAVLALYLHGYAWDAAGAEREFKRALELDAGQPLTHQYYSTFLRSIGRFEEAIFHGRRAVELDPLVPGFSETLAFTLLRAGRNDEAARQIRSTLELDSTYWRAHAVQGLVYELTQRFDEAIAAYEMANQLAGPAAHRTTPDIARVLAMRGETGKARQLMDAVRATAARTGAFEVAAATAWYALHDNEAAFAWLETAFRQKQPHLRFLDGDPRFAEIARDARFNELMQRVGMRP